MTTAMKANTKYDVRDLARGVDAHSLNRPESALALGWAISNRLSGCDNKYGRQLVKKLAKQLEISEDVLYRCLQLADNWSADDIAKVGRLRTSGGRSVEVSHLLSMIPKKKHKLTFDEGMLLKRSMLGSFLLEDLTVRELLSTRELAVRIIKTRTLS